MLAATPTPTRPGRAFTVAYDLSPDPSDSHVYPLTFDFGVVCLNALDIDLQNYSLNLIRHEILAEAKTFMFNSTLSCQAKIVEDKLELSELTSGYTWGNIYLI